MSFKRRLKRNQDNKRKAYTPGNLGPSAVAIEKRKHPEKKFYNGPLFKVNWTKRTDKKGRLVFFATQVEM